jgi:hypothetical protein
MPLVRTKSISHPLARDTDVEDREKRSGQTHLTIRAMVRNSASRQCELVAQYLFTNLTTIDYSGKVKRSGRVYDLFGLSEI